MGRDAALAKRARRFRGRKMRTSELAGQFRPLNAAEAGRKWL
jgi:hypothetical protein